MKKWALIFFCLFSLPVIGFDIGEYQYFARERLAKNLKKFYIKHHKKHGDKPFKVKIVDELVKIWKIQELDGGWVRFDTKYFRCIIQRSNSSRDPKTGYPRGYDLVRQVYEYQKKFKSAKKIKKTLKDPKKAWLHYGLLAIYGKVVYSNKWGEVGSGKDEGVKPEVLVIEVDEVRVPRSRFYKLYKKK
ncbi:MAG: hypothetical protein D6785_02835 [Planctomycetota bacterium]|nr:MAG: hypothetical protein D6785_02835 [Planctomycetota bacterium]